jgi:hypothetical protein
MISFFFVNSYPYTFTCINILLTQTHSSVKVVMYMPTLLRVIFLSNVFLLDSFFFVFLTLYLFISYRQIGNCIGIDYSSLHIYVYICICMLFLYSWHIWKKMSKSWFYLWIYRWLSANIITIIVLLADVWRVLFSLSF